MRQIPIALAALVLGAAPAAFAGGAAAAAPEGAAAGSVKADWNGAHAGPTATVASVSLLRHDASSDAVLDPVGAGSGASALGTALSRAALTGAVGTGLDHSAAPWSDRLPTADEVIVRKSERRLFLMRHGKVLRSFHVELGLEPDGAKREAGDFRTPEGLYQLTRRNPHSLYFMSIQISYPNATDMALARRDHVDPGGSIMIHGMPNDLSHPPAYYSEEDWTDGCIALSDADMVAVWLMTRPDTPILILP